MIPISVIIPMYNSELYISRCLDALISQNIDIEIICVNDGSYDRTSDIVKAYSRRYSNIIIIEQENKGQSSARNKGLEYASGQYVFFCDSDDYIDSNSLEELYSIAIKYDLDILKTGWKTVIGNDIFYTYVKKSLPLNMVISSSVFLTETCLKWHQVVPVNGLVKLGFLNENNLRFPEGIQFEDNFFHLSMLLAQRRSSRCMLIDSTFYTYTINPGSTTTQSVTPKKLYDQLENVSLMKDLIEQSKLNETEYRAAMASVSSLLFTFTSYYYRLPKIEQKKFKSSFNKRIFIQAIKYSPSIFQKTKLFLFIYLPIILDIYSDIKLVCSRTR